MAKPNGPAGNSAKVPVRLASNTSRLDSAFATKSPMKKSLKASSSAALLAGLKASKKRQPPWPATAGTSAVGLVSQAFPPNPNKAAWKLSTIVSLGF